RVRGRGVGGGSVMVRLGPAAGLAQDGRATLDGAAKALGADGLSSLQLSGTGSSFAAGQSAVPRAPWPRFTLTSFTRQINYDTAPPPHHPPRPPPGEAPPG